MTDADLEGLRRRLYSRDAEPADRARFATALAEQEASTRAAEAAEREALARATAQSLDDGRADADADHPVAIAQPSSGAASRTARRRIVIGAAALTLVAAAVVGVAVAVAARPATSVVPPLALHPLPVGEGSRNDLQAYSSRGVQNVPSDDFAGALFQAGFGAFPPVSTTAVTGGSGTGPATVRTDPWSAAGRRGELTVVLVLARAGSAGVVVAAIDGPTEHRLRAASVRSLTAGVPAVGRFAFAAADLPTVFHVTVARGTPWILELVYSR